MFDFQRIKKECFWDVAMSRERFDELVNAQDTKKKQYLFEKILLNSTKILVSNMLISQFNRAHILRRKNLVEVYFFNKELQIDELKWVA